MRDRRQSRPGTAALAALAVLTSGAGAGALTLTPGTQWPGGPIPVCWESTDRAHRQERDLIRKAVRITWERESAVRLTGWRRCRPGDGGIRISLGGDYPRARARGTGIDGLVDGVQLPTLWSLAALSINMKAPVHEFGHALGFGHEYARPDAPNSTFCATGTRAGRFYVEAEDQPLTPFDYDSIMVGCLQGATAQFSRGVPQLSALDIFGLVRTYGSHPDNVLDTDEAGDRFGAALLVRDLDGDGTRDLAVGAPGEDAGQGAVYLYRGDRISGFRPWYRVTAQETTEEFGVQLGWADAAAGRPAAITVGTAGEGYAMVLRARAPPLVIARARPGGAGHTPPTLPDLRAPPSRFGFPPLVDPAGIVRADLNGDGNPDLVIGLPDARIEGTRSGAVMIYQGMIKTWRGHGPFRPWYWFGQAY